MALKQFAKYRDEVVDAGEPCISKSVIIIILAMKRTFFRHQFFFFFNNSTKHFGISMSYCTIIVIH